MRFEIASKIWDIEVEDSEIRRWLEPELQQYAHASGDPEIIVHFGHPEAKIDSLSQNPQPVSAIVDGFTARYGYLEVTWRWNEAIPRVSVEFLGRQRHWGRKLLGRQYSHPVEETGQYFHELVLIPSLMLFFSESIAPVHASALQAPSGGALMLCGTGGVGKTSLGLQLGWAHGYRFLADDITLLNADGLVWPNLAYPKIYGYNLVDDPGLQRVVFQGRGIVDRLAWVARKSVRSPAGVRRRISPATLFPAGVADPARLERVVFLFRQAVEAPVLEALSLEAAIQMAVRVLHTEYSSAFFNPLSWYAYNQVGLGANQGPKPEAILDSIGALLHRALAGRQIQILRLPIGMSQAEFRSRIPPMLAD